MARIVLATIGSYGDLYPFIALAHGLAARGHTPVIASSPGYREMVAEAGITFTPMRPDLTDFGHIENVEQRVNDLRKGSETVVREIVMPNLRQSHTDLSAAAEDADLIVTQILAFTGRMVAEERGIPWAATALTPLPFASTIDPPRFPNAPWLQTLHSVSPWLYRRLFGLVRRHVASWSKPIHDFRRELGLPPQREEPLLEGQFSPHLNLALFSPLFAQPQADWPPNTRVTGFLFNDAYHERQANRYTEVLQRLAEFVAAQGPPLVFVLGTTAVLNAGDFYAESVRAARRVQRPAVIVTGSDARNRPDALLGEDILALEYVPYEALFPQAALVVHQGGIGTLAETLRAGVPMVVVPFSHDQPDNANLAQRMGVADSVAREAYRADAVADVLRRVLDDPAYARRAEEAGAQIRRERGIENACAALEELLARAREGKDVQLSHAG